MLGRPSVGEELIEGAQILEHAGILNARREATAIWASLAGIQLGDVWLERDGEAPESRACLFRTAVERRAQGEPLPYVVGVAGFRKLDLLVDGRVLIPRPETEGLVHHVLAWGERREATTSAGWGTVADIGTGSGCIALSLALEGRFERVIATDVSAEALQVAAENLRELAPQTPLELRCGSLLEPLTDVRLDAIVSNPPYLTPSEHAGLDRGVRDYEPPVALVGGGDGMEHVRTLVDCSAEFLVPGGLLAIEVDSSRAYWTLQLAHAAGWTHARIEADLFGSSRYLLAIKES